MSTPLIDLSPINSILARLESVADRLERGTGFEGEAPRAAAAANSSAAAEPPIVQALDAFIKEKVEPVQKAAEELAVAQVTDGTNAVVEIFRLLRCLLAATAVCKKPADSDWQLIFMPVAEVNKKAQDLKKDKRDEYYDNGCCVCEAATLFMLVTQTATADHCQNVLESFDFHAIKVMKKQKEKESAWIKALKAMVQGMKQWCTENCKMGITWNGGGQDAKSYFEANPLGSAQAAGAAPKAKGKGKGGAPPPPAKAQLKAPPKFEDEDKPKAGGGGGMAAVFGQISNFSTGGLKKVTDDMKTKNRPDEEKTSVVTAKGGGYAAPKTAAAPSAKPKKPPSKQLKNDKWYIENFEEDRGIVVEDPTPSQLVAIINCNNSVVKVDKRVKALIVDGCKKLSLVVQDVISTVEFVNSERCQCQILGKVNSIAIDKCSGVNVYMSKESLEATVTSSKSCEMNLNIPNAAGDEFTEVPIPEQFVTKILPGSTKLKTEVSDLYC